MSDTRVLHLTIHFEQDQIWAEVDEYPGCFAAGRNMEELQEALVEALSFYLAEGDSPASVSAVRLEDDATASTRVPALVELAPC